MSTSEDSIATAIIQAVREGLSRTQQATPPQSTYRRVSAIGSGSPSTSSSSPSTGPSGSGSTSTSTGGSGGTKRAKFTLPSLFQSKSKQAKGKENKTKSSQYLRDIFCLPRQLKGKKGTVNIPRGTHRSELANHLMGKIEFQSDWSADKMRREICAVFAKPFALSKNDVEEGLPFPFEYLQRTGAGSRTLCIPPVSQSFEWNGKQVATLAKSGGVIYILANEDIPGLSLLGSVSIQTA